MKRLERILWIVVLFAALLKVLRLPLSSFLLIVALMVLSILYFFLAWMVLPRPGRKDQLVELSVPVGLVLSTACIGILFKLQVWPVATTFLSVALIGLVIALLAVGLWRRNRPELGAYFRGLLQRLVPLLVCCAVLLSISPGRLMAFYYRDRPDIAPLMVRSIETTDPAERERIFQQIDSINYARAFGSAVPDQTKSNTRP